MLIYRPPHRVGNAESAIVKSVRRAFTHPSIHPLNQVLNWKEVGGEDDESDTPKFVTLIIPLKKIKSHALKD